MKVNREYIMNNLKELKGDVNETYLAYMNDETYANFIAFDDAHSRYLKEKEKQDYLMSLTDD